MFKLLRLPKLAILWNTKEAHQLVKTALKWNLDRLNNSDN
jgi:hypothetical protein